MVRDVFRLAKENSPAIIFIDEIDAIATAWFDAQTGADAQEVPRILMELLNQMDGFDQTVNVKVIVATNRADTLESALLRPGRLDCDIEFPLPDRRQKRLIFQVCFLTPSVLKFSVTCHFHCYGHYLDASQKNVKFLIGVWS
jgi:26S proteasome regulatory subunit T3